MRDSHHPSARNVALTLSALGHEARLEIFKLLVRCGTDGMLVGDIGKRVGMTPSTLAHHLKTLLDADLIEQERRGREVINRTKFATLDQTITYLLAECCLGPPD